MQTRQPTDGAHRRVVAVIAALAALLASAVAQAQGGSAEDRDAGTQDGFRPVVIVSVGDMMLGTTHPDAAGGLLPPDDGAGLFAGVAPVLKAADIAFGNLEAPLHDGTAEPTCTEGALLERSRGRPGGTTCWAFRTPTRYGRHLSAAGFDVLSLANNHVDDFGAAGRASTIATLAELGLKNAGPRDATATFDVRGTRVAILAFSTSPGHDSMDDVEGAADRVRRAASAADIVMVSFHGGREGTDRVTGGPESLYDDSRGDVRRFAHAVIDAGADLVVGHGPHLVRGLEVYRGRLVAYSLGNFATSKGIRVDGLRGHGFMLETSLGRDGALVSGRIVPVRQVRPHGPRVHGASPVIPLLRRLSARDFGRDAASFDAAGTLLPPQIESP